MKKSISILLGIFLSALIIYGGSGVNAYFYCCDDCRSEGISAVSEHKCCEIHHHHHLGGLITHYDEHQCHQTFSENTEECGVERIFVNWNTSSQSATSLQPFFTNIDKALFVSAEDMAFEVNLAVEPFIGLRTQKPPNLSKDDYFSLLATLLI